MNWLAFILLAALVLVPDVARAQAERSWRIGVLMPERPGALEAIVAGLGEFRYVEGRNMILDVRRAARGEQLPSLALELVKLNPDVIITVTGTAALALRKATKTIPIVMATSGDAVRQGLVASLARPGGNVTGFTVISTELTAKRFQILKDVVPAAQRIGALGCPRDDEAVNRQQAEEAKSAARQMSLQLVPMFIRHLDEMPAALKNAMAQKIDAVLVFDCGILTPPESVTTALNNARVPAIYHAPRYVYASGLMSYGANSTELYRRAATFVDKILKGAKPADIPVEQPTKFELVINMKTARTLGLTIPQAFLARADEVIQ